MQRLLIIYRISAPVLILNFTISLPGNQLLTKNILGNLEHNATKIYLRIKLMLYGSDRVKGYRKYIYYFSEGVIDIPKIIKYILLDIVITIEHALLYPMGSKLLSLHK